MRTPVYRHLGARGGILGVSPIGWMPVLLVAWLGMLEDRPNQGVLAAAGLYVVLRVAGHGRPDGFLQHLVQWRWRRARSGGRLSAAARSRAPQFPHAGYDPPWARRGP